MNINLDSVFGPGNGGTPRDRARESKRVFVRSMDQLAEDSIAAKGRRLTASEALDAYGLDILVEVAHNGAALLTEGPRAAARLIKARRELLGLREQDVATAAHVGVNFVEVAESGSRVPIRELEKIARGLGLDERLVSWRSEPPPGNEELAVRLRSIGDQLARMAPTSVAGIAEAAWVAATQLRLQKQLGIHPEPPDGIEHSSNYGGPGYPAFQHGYWLAADARKKLGLGGGQLAASLRELAEDRLGIPIIQAELGASIAGVTVETGSDRAIVLNLAGRNRNVYVRRATLAHELGHLLYDPPMELRRLRVDEYDELDQAPHQLADYVEQRANAFAVEFIAPQTAVVEIYTSAKNDRVGTVMDEFGVSSTAARYQIWNAMGRTVPLESLRADPSRRPDLKWEALEAYTANYHPIRTIRASRAGRFSAVVARAAEKSLVSWETAAEMLEAEAPEQVQQAVPFLRELFPKVF